MDPEKNLQAEDSPVVNEPEPQSSPEMAVESPKKGWVDRAIPWVIVGLVCFLAGAIITWFALYQPKVQALKTAQADLVTATENAAQLQNKLDATIADLADSETTLEEKSNALVQSEKFGLLYKFQADVNAARYSLINLKPASASQALGYALTDLTELAKTDLDTDTLAGFQEKVDEANNKLSKMPESALTTLDTLHEDLLYLISNIK